MKRILLLFLLVFTATTIFAQTALKGKVTDPDSGEELPFATIQLYKDGSFVNGSTTDLEGNYFFSNIDPGTYDIKVDYTGYPQVELTGIPVNEGRTNVADVKMSNSGGVNLDEIVVVGFKVPLIEQDNTTSGQTITSEQINNLPTRNINQLASITAGASSADEGGAINIRGSRSDATNYYVDGVRVSANNLTDADIEQLQVITGGVEARYGDVTGGIISITTKGPSNKFGINAEVETSEGLDAFGNSLAGLSLQGPILRNSKGNSILGFRLSGRYTYREDDDPSAVPIYRIKDDKLAELEANPVLRVGSGEFVAADFLNNDDVDVLKTRPFEASSNYNINGRLDLRVSDAIDLSLSGFYSDAQNQFTPNENRANSWGLLAAHNNPTRFDQDARVNFRFRHRLGGSGVADGGSGNSIIQNASYTLQLTVENNSANIADPRHGENFFDYGYVGKFDVDFIPVFDFEFSELGGLNAFHTDYRGVLRGFDASNSTNPVLANYNNTLPYITSDVSYTDDLFGFTGAPSISNLENGVAVPTIDDFAAINGQTQNILTDSWDFNTNVGTVFNSFSRSDNDLYTFQANASFDIIPGSSDKSRHSIQLGVLYEQRTNRSYRLNPRALWQLGRQLINSPLNAVDTTNRVVGTQDIGIPGFDQVNVFAPTNDGSGGQFFRNVRESLGVPLDQLVNIDGLSPDQLDLAMFSAAELTNVNILDYVGYDYLGNEFNGTFDDFFAIDPTTGERSFNVAPNRPIYAAAFLQDKFTINKMIFRVGVRVDRFDANTRVLKDPWSLYEIQGADDFHNNFGGNQPGSIGDDYAVYTSEEGGNTVQAYRSGDNWFQADGTPTNGPQEIAGIRTGLVFPAYADPEAEAGYIKRDNFRVESAFQDYEVQFNVMPRLAFSFPISEDANFFAHYDVLLQRPPSNALATALDYYYFEDRAGGTIFANPALRPERTVDYELGFKTRISETSALTITAYYKELRDMIQLRVYFPVPVVNQYTTYDNQDFATVKGFSFTYDLRRTANFTVNANYTLQFADGTGSDANSSSGRGLSNRGNLRTLFPLNFDERHRVNLVLDYRVPSNSNVPAFLRDLGMNVQTSAVSGRPFTATFLPTEFGGSGTIGAVNGARKPFTFTVNAQVNKDFKIGKDARMNVYFRVSNLLDRRNVLNVYSATGSAEDPGFLQSSFGQDRLAQLSNGTQPVESYLAAYQWRVLNPDLFTLPRRMFLGAQFSL
jgi:outer membrane receptor protein involved in Fe transport